MTIDEADGQWDLFISYASEDRNEVAEPLAKVMTDCGLKVWYDQTALRIGDSLRRKIDEGLARCRYGVVILSPSFFLKHYPNRELDGLAQREVGGHTVILPIWHKVTDAEVRAYSLPLADRIAGRWADGLVAVAVHILEVVRPDLVEEAMRELRELEKKLEPLPQLHSGRDLVKKKALATNILGYLLSGGAGFIAGRATHEEAQARATCENGERRPSELLKSVKSDLGLNRRSTSWKAPNDFSTEPSPLPEMLRDLAAMIRPLEAADDATIAVLTTLFEVLRQADLLEPMTFSDSEAQEFIQKFANRGRTVAENTMAKLDRRVPQESIKLLSNVISHETRRLGAGILIALSGRQDLKFPAAYTDSEFLEALARVRVMLRDMKQQGNLGDTAEARLAIQSVAERWLAAGRTARELAVLDAIGAALGTGAPHNPTDRADGNRKKRRSRRSSA